jgi:hypothetical protein
MSRIYLTGLDEKYFFLGVTLIQSLERYVPRTSIAILNFGLLPAQKSFFGQLGLLVFEPPSDLKGAHPYTLKAHINRFQGIDVFEAYSLVLLDADMIACGNFVEKLDEVIEDMNKQRALIACSADMGTAEGALDFFDKFRCLKARAAATGYANLRYLNIGLCVFSPDFDWLGFARLANHFEPETCWEQNAINVLRLRGDLTTFVLDSKVWNFHGSLLADWSQSLLQAYFVHLTSPYVNTVQEGILNLEYKDKDFKFFYRLGVRPDVAALQRELIRNTFESYDSEFLSYAIKQEGQT